MLKKEIKIYLNELRKEKRAKLNEWFEEYEKNHPDCNKKRETYEDDEYSSLLKQEIYVLSYFPIVVSESKYNQTSIKLLTHDFEEITPEVLQEIVTRVIGDVMMKAPKEQKLDDKRFVEKVIKRILFYYHDYTGCERAKYGKF